MSEAASQVPSAMSSAKRGGTASVPPVGLTLRPVLEGLGWAAVLDLIYVGLDAIIQRALFMSFVLNDPQMNPAEALDPFNVRYFNHPAAVGLHLGPGLLVMVLGPLQFIRRVRKKWIGAHRWSGRAFLLAGGIAAMSGIAIGVFDPFLGVTGQGFNESMATLFFSIFTLFCLVMAVVRIKQRRVGQHREWMVRSWAMLLAVASERVLLQALQANTEIAFPDIFGTTFWMAAVINLVAAETWINLTRTPGTGAAHWKDLTAATRAAHRATP